MFKHFEFVDLFGYVGAVLIIIGFAMLSAGMLLPKDILYQALNFFGGIGIVITAFSHKDYPSGALNIVFAGIALVAFIATYLI